MNHIKVIVLSYLIILLSTPVAVQAQGCAAPAADGGITVFGFLQPQIETSFNRNSTDHTFAFNRARIGVTGAIPYDFVYYAVIEASPNFAGAPFLLDAFISYTRFKWAQLTIGQFKSHFTLEMATPCHSLTTINRSQAVINLVSPDRDIGVMLSGLLFNDRLSYNMALTNGTGRGMRDDNNAKTFHSRIQVTPFEFLKLGGGIQYGVHPPADESILTDDSRFRWAADMQFQFRNLTLIGEYISGQDKGSYVVGGGCGLPPEILMGDLNRSGFYITAMYRTPWNLQPVFRYETWNTDTSSLTASEHTMVFGLNYWFNDWTRVQLNYLYRAEERVEIFNDQLLLQVQVMF